MKNHCKWISQHMINNKNINIIATIIIIPRGIKIPGWHTAGDSYASWSGWDNQPWLVTFLEMVSQ